MNGKLSREAQNMLADMSFVEEEVSTDKKADIYARVIKKVEAGGTGAVQVKVHRRRLKPIYLSAAAIAACALAGAGYATSVYLGKIVHPVDIPPLECYDPALENPDMLGTVDEDGMPASSLLVNRQRAPGAGQVIDSMIAGGRFMVTVDAPGFPPSGVEWTWGHRTVNYTDASNAVVSLTHNRLEEKIQMSQALLDRSEVTEMEIGGNQFILVAGESFNTLFLYLGIRTRCTPPRCGSFTSGAQRSSCWRWQTASRSTIARPTPSRRRAETSLRACRGGCTGGRRHHCRRH